MKTIIIHANCQGGIYKHAFEQALAFKEFDIYHYRNFSQEPIPESVLSKASYFIYQFLDDKWNDLASAELLKRIPGYCTAIQIPKLSFRSYWPSSCPKDPRFVASDAYPAGLYPYGDSLLTNAIGKFGSIEETVDYYASLDFAQHYDLDHILLQDLNYLGEEQNAKDIDVSSYVENNFRKKKLFETPNHPTDILYQHVFDRLCSLLFVDSSYSIRSYFEIYQLPIHASVAKYHSLEFFGDRYNIFGCNVSARDYSRGYLLGEPVHRFDTVNAVNAMGYFMKNGASFS